MVDVLCISICDFSCVNSEWHVVCVCVCVFHTRIVSINHFWQIPLTCCWIWILIFVFFFVCFGGLFLRTFWVKCGLWRMFLVIYHAQLFHLWEVSCQRPLGIQLILHDQYDSLIRIVLALILFLLVVSKITHKRC